MGDVECEVVLSRSWMRCDVKIIIEIIVKVGRIDETRE
jgi:hypothetical protein